MASKRAINRKLGFYSENEIYGLESFKMVDA